MPGHDGQTGFNRFGDKSYLMTALRLAGRSLPGDYVRTFVYLNLIYKPRLALRRLVSTFYRMDHVYTVIGEFRGASRARSRFWNSASPTATRSRRKPTRRAI